MYFLKYVLNCEQNFSCIAFRFRLTVTGLTEIYHNSVWDVTEHSELDIRPLTAVNTKTYQVHFTVSSASLLYPRPLGSLNSDNCV
jgi:hypothetical protein